MEEALENIFQVAQTLGQDFVSDKEFNDLLKTIYEEEIEDMPKSDSKSPRIPVLIVLGYENEQGVRPGMRISIAEDGDTWKSPAFLNKLGAKLCDSNFPPLVAFLVAEAWLSNNESLMPSKDPTHQEALLISGMTMDLRCNLAKCLVEKDRTYDKPEFLLYSPDQPKDMEYKNQILFNLFAGYLNTQFKNN